MKRIAILLFLVAQCACANPYTTTIIMNDGARIQAMPSCVTGPAENRTLRGSGIEDGVPVDDVRALRSHAGVEPTIVGAAMLAAGVTLLVWGLTDDRQSGDLRTAAGGVVGGIGLIQVVVGALLWRSSVRSLDHECHFRSRWYGSDTQP